MPFTLITSIFKAEMVISDCLYLIGTFKNPEGIEAKFHGSGDPFAKK